jgi:acyl-CoA thioesterase FadM
MAKYRHESVVMRQPRERAPHAASTGLAMTPIETLRTTIYPCHCDVMGHLTTSQYALLFDAATWALLHHLQIHDDFGRDARLGWADVDARTQYQHEVPAGSLVKIVSRITRVGTTSMGIEHVMCASEGDTRYAIFEASTVRFDRGARRAVCLPQELQRVLIRS